MKKLSTLPIILSLVVTACGEYKTDPLRNHKVPENLKLKTGPDEYEAPPAKVEVVVKEVPVQVDKEVIKEVPVDRPVYYPTEEKKNFAANQLFQITAQNALSFVAGIEGTARFTVRALQGNVEFSVRALNLPNGAGAISVVKTQQNSQVVEFKFKPELKMIDPSSQEFRPEEGSGIRLQMVVKSIKGSDDQNTTDLTQAYNAVSLTKEFSYVVRRDTRAPKISELAGFPSVINEGDSSSFSVKFSAPGTYPGFEPKVYVVPNYNGIVNDLYDNVATGFIRPSKTRKVLEFVGDGVWIANFDLDTNLAPVPQQLDRQLRPVADAQSTWMRFAVFVSSPAGTQSDEFVQRFQIMYKPKAPVAAPAAPEAAPAAPEATPAQGSSSTPSATPKVIPTPRPKPTSLQGAGNGSMERP